MKSVEERLEAIETRIALSELRSKYCWYTTRGQKEEVLALFTEDGVFENHRTPTGEPAIAAGQAELRVYFERMAPGRRLPIVTNEVSHATRDEAEGTSVMFSVGDEGFCGHYVDHFRRENGVWRFRKRSFFPYWPIFAPSTERSDP